MNYFNGNSRILNNWISRSTCAAAVLNSKLNIKYVYDLGCGKAGLKTLIPTKKYVGLDETPQTNNVQKVDFNKCFPNISLGTRKNRAATCLGLLEYIANLDKFFKELSVNFNLVIFSYVDTNKYKLPVSKINNVKVLQLIKNMSKYFTVSFLCTPHNTRGNLYQAYKQ